jgi:hypothetical protein
VFDSRRHTRSTPPPSGLAGDHADKARRVRWYFVTAFVLGALAVFVLPTPFSGIASLACVGLFVTGGVRRINGGDPEMVKRTTSSGIIGGGG